MQTKVASGVGYGAIGGAVSALTANDIAKAVTNGQGVTDPAQLAIITAGTTLLGGGIAAALGQNAAGAVNSAANETLNNACAHGCGEDPNDTVKPVRLEPPMEGSEQDSIGPSTGVETETVTVGAGALAAGLAGAGPSTAATDSGALDQSTIETILSTPKGSRPDPSTYLSQDYIDSQLSQFEGGVTKISSAAPTGVVGPPGGTFVMPTSVANQIIGQAGGSVPELEGLLGLDAGTLGTSPVRIDIPNPYGLRMPSGNELGANSQWIPGGVTSGGIPEATIDPAHPGTYTVGPLF